MSISASFWIRGGRVLARSHGEWRLARTDVQVSGDRIAKVLNDPPPAPLQDGDLDATGLLVIPGLINAHVHSNDDFLRGRVDKLPLEIYMLMAVPVTGVADFDAEDLEVRTLLGAAEGLRTGTTCFLDDCYHIDRLRPESIAAVLGSYDKIGMRAWVTANLSDKPMPDTVPYVREHLLTGQYEEITRSRLPPGEALAYCEQAIRDRNNTATRVKVAMAASGPQRCTDAFLQQIWEIVERYQVPCVSHVLETRIQAMTGDIFYGETLVAHMARLGCLTPRTVIAHGVWVTDSDIEAIAQSGASVVHNPTSNLRLGSGVAPIAKMLRSGVNVALGADGMTSNDAQNLFLEMRLAGCLHNIKGEHYGDWIGAKEAFTMGTCGGARAVGMEAELGAVAEGKLADLTLLDQDSFAYVPINDPVQNIVFSEYGQSVRHVLVGGEVVVRDRRLTRINEDDLYARGREAAERFFTNNATAFQRIPEFLPAFEAAYQQAWATEYRRDRWLPRE
jgi:5-methylthioadenosine/S-adenosylhomocysteine deaminase